MENLKSFYNQLLESTSYHLIKIFSYFKKLFNNAFELFVKNKYYFLIKDFLFLFVFFLFPALGIFIKDYIHDQSEITKAEQALEKSLLSYVEHYNQFFHALKEKILSENLQEDANGMKLLLTDIQTLNSYSVQFPLNAITGLRWITTDLKAIGLYGNLQNFNSNAFFPLLRSSESTPNAIQLARVKNQIYLGMGIGKDGTIKGYLLLPSSLERISSPLKLLNTTLIKFSSELHLPSISIPLDELQRKPLFFLQSHQRIEWLSYFYRNCIAYIIFLLFAFSMLILKKRLDAKKENVLSLLKNKIHSLSESLMAQQKAANLVITRFHDGVTSINEISKVLLEAKTQSSSNVFSEKEQIKFVKKIYETSLVLEEPVIKKKTNELFDILEIMDQCLNFYSYKIEEDSIQVRKDYSVIKTSFSSDKESFYQLALNLFHKALERTPEKGSILIKMRGPKRNEDCLLIVTIEDNGYPFSPEELKVFKKKSPTLFGDYFDLEWEKIFSLARSLRCQISFESTSPIGNKISIQIREHKISKEEPIYGDNIIRLFPSS